MGHAEVVVDHETRIVHLEHALARAHFHAGLPVRLVGFATDEAQRTYGVIGHHLVAVVADDALDILGLRGLRPAVDGLLDPALRGIDDHCRSPVQRGVQLSFTEQQAWAAGCWYSSCRRVQFSPWPFRSGIPSQPSPRPNGVRSR
ncbi:hypothetical protein D3C80_1785370 [compost metagenome]